MNHAKIAAGLFLGLFVFHALSALRVAAFAIRSFQAPSHGEELAWAPLTAFVAAILLFWASIALVSAVGLWRMKLFGWILGILFCVGNVAFLILGFSLNVLAPVYIGIIGYLCLKQTRTPYFVRSG